MDDLISRQAAIAHAVPLNLFGREVMMVSVSELENLPSAQPEPLTDKEQRIFLAAMGREEKVCKQVDDECRDCREPYEDSQENDYDTAIKMGIEALKAHTQPVTPMHWIPVNPFNGGWSARWECSACGSKVTLGYCTDVMPYDFCPYCGAKDGGTDDRNMD